MSIIQDHDPEARARDGDHLYTVGLTIPQIGGSSPQDVGEVFVRVLKDWFEGHVDTLVLDVTDEYTNAYRMVEIRAKDLV